MNDHDYIECETCNSSGEVEVTVYRRGMNTVYMDKKMMPCQECCNHADLDHGVCIDCGLHCENMWAVRTFSGRDYE